jgi:hypothetical protein
MPARLALDIAMKEEPTFDVGDHVSKLRGDYSFEGVIVAAFNKLSGARRYVVENRDGVLHIFSGSNLGLMPRPARASNDGAPGSRSGTGQA